MKFSHRLLRELSGTKKSAKELERLLMFHAFEVESVEKYPHHLNDVLIGVVIEKKKHPNADRLSVTMVDVGRLGIHTIICGAPNVEVGQKVAVVLPGATLPGGFTIEEREIRGVKSSGMICSERELSLGETQEGILVLPDNAPIGAIFVKHFGIDDSILDIKILPDRAGDALSYQGVAREIAALDGYAPQFSEIEKKQLRIPAYNRAPKVTILAKPGCSRYLGLYFEHIHNQQSPLWLKVRLLLSGLRPKNVIVDITNYLMLITGQPVHAFDADKLTKGLSVRKAKKGEKLKLLTDEIVKLDPHDMVIADSKGPVALAGVMGGKRSAVSDKTKNVFLEIASFDPLTIRKTRVRHKLFTDASYRYERGLDNNIPKEVAIEAVELFQELTGAKLLGMRDVKLGSLSKSKTIRLSLDRVNGIIGSKVPLFEVVQYLALLGLKVKTLPDRKNLSVTVPPRRKDLSDEWNLIEEIARMRGYDKVLAEAPRVPLTLAVAQSFAHFEDKVKDLLASRGYTETLSYSFLSEKEIEFTNSGQKLYCLTNPLNPEEKVLRPSLLPGLTRTVFKNIRLQEHLQFFEVGALFSKGKDGPLEQNSASWVVKNDGVDNTSAFFEMKSELEALFKTFNAPTRRYVPNTSKIFEAGFGASVYIGKVKVAELGIISNNLTGLYSKNAKLVSGAEVSLEALGFILKNQAIVIQPLPRFPKAVRDISLLVPSDVSAEKMEEVFQKYGAPLLETYTLFDLFEKDNRKRFGYHLTFGEPGRTITGKEMEACFQNIVQGAEAELGASL